ncbi:MAG: DNA repair protein RecO [Pseudomonadales bacterium]|nr:DNA repair protein RecO [Pseudomonadales bacterium]
MDSKVDLQPAYILHSRPYRDTSAIVDFFTQDYGRVSAVANGARRAKSPWRAALQPFRLVLVSWKGKSDLKSVRDVDLGETPYPLGGKALLSGMYLNELIVRLTHRFVGHPGLFDTYQQTLGKLSEDPICDDGIDSRREFKVRYHIETQLRQFELGLLEELGYGLCLDREADGVTVIKSDGTYRFDDQHGFEWVEGIVPVDWMGLCFSGQSLLSLSKRCYDNETILKDAKRLMRLALAPHLGGKPLESRKLFLGPNTEPQS